MDIEQGRSLLRGAQADRIEARKQLDVAQATIEASQLIIQGVLRRFPELAAEEKEWEAAWEEAANPERPKGSDAVLQVLQVNENQWFTIRELVRQLEQLQWIPDSANPPNAVRAAVERLVKTPDSGVIKAEDGDGTVVYRFSEPVTPQPAPRLPSDKYYDEEPF